jgi:serine/threonine protein kinase
MIYCLQPNCLHPQNPEDVSECLSCGSKLLLQNRYRVLKPLGQGGFGRTFLAVDETHPSQILCTIKQFLPQAQSPNNHPKAEQLLHQEALQLARLGEHPQIPELLASFTEDGQQYLVQEFIDGQNLEEELALAGAFNETQIRQLLGNLLPVLQFVHNQQIIHRDIKPANIIRLASSTLSCQGDARKGQLVLVDFGTAKSADSKALVKTGTVIGSAEYAAPEQIRGKAVFASDLYSLGVTCIHLLTQMSPFDMYDSIEDTWVWQDYLNFPVSKSLAQILDKLLQNAMRQRYQSVQEVLKDLTAEPMQVRVASLPTVVTDEEDFETPYFGASFPEIPQQFISLTNTKSFLPVTPIISATLFDPQTQSWCRLPNILEHSKSVWAVAPFMSPRLPVAAYIPFKKATPPQANSIPTKSSWRVLATLWVAILACLAIGLRLKQPSTDSEIPHLSEGVHDYLELSQKEGK